MEPIHFEATLASGLSIVESDTVGFVDIPQDLLATFKVNCDGQVFGVRLADGAFIVNEDVYTPKVTLDTPLRLVYYKTMQAEILGARVDFIHTPRVHCVVVGWQTTIVLDDGQYKNLKFGIKIYPNEQHWEITEDI